MAWLNSPKGSIILLITALTENSFELHVNAAAASSLKERNYCMLHDKKGDDDGNYCGELADVVIHTFCLLICSSLCIGSCFCNHFSWTNQSTIKFYM